MQMYYNLLGSDIAIAHKSQVLFNKMKSFKTSLIQWCVLFARRSSGATLRSLESAINSWDVQGITLRISAKKKGVLVGRVQLETKKTNEPLDCN